MWSGEKNFLKKKLYKNWTRVKLSKLFTELLPRRGNVALAAHATNQIA